MVKLVFGALAVIGLLVTFVVGMLYHALSVDKVAGTATNQPAHVTVKNSATGKPIALQDSTAVTKKNPTKKH